MLNGFYSVFNPRGQKIADCGAERDAVWLLQARNQRWEGHYYQFNPIPGCIVDVPNNDWLQLPTRDIVVNMDGGVGGSWYENLKLPESYTQEIDLNHDQEN